MKGLIFLRTDEYYMRKALELAKRGEGYTSPNPMVGALIVKNGEIISSGYHKYFGGPHAEINALKDAGRQVEGATIYVNLEPCSHYGKTPPCSLALIKAGIKKAVIAMEDPNPLVAGRGIKQLKKAGIEIKSGVLEKEARDLNEVFIKYISSDYPFIYLKMAQTLDGFLASKNGDSKWISNKKARLYTHKLRHKVDAILVGINTLINDNPRLTTRLTDGTGKDSLRIVLDTKLKIPLHARIINQQSSADTLIVTAKDINKEKKERLINKQGVEILSLDLEENNEIPLKVLLKILHERNISSILVEGGGKINYSFLNNNLIDKLYAFIAPKILGGRDGISVFNGIGPESIKKAIYLQEVEYKILDDNIVLIAKYQGGI